MNFGTSADRFQDSSSACSAHEEAVAFGCRARGEGAGRSDGQARHAAEPTFPLFQCVPAAAIAISMVAVLEPMLKRDSGQHSIRVAAAVPVELAAVTEWGKMVHYESDNITWESTRTGITWDPSRHCQMPPPPPYYLQVAESGMQTAAVSYFFGSVSITGAMDPAGFVQWAPMLTVAAFQIGMVPATIATTALKFSNETSNFASLWEAYSCFGVICTEGPWFQSTANAITQTYITKCLLSQAVCWFTIGGNSDAVRHASTWKNGKGRVTEIKVILLRVLSILLLCTFGISYVPVLATHVLPGMIVFMPATWPLLVAGFLTSKKLGAFEGLEHIRKGVYGKAQEEQMKECQKKQKIADRLAEDAQETARNVEEYINAQACYVEQCRSNDPQHWIKEIDASEKAAADAVKDAAAAKEHADKEAKAAEDAVFEAAANARRFQYVLMLLAPFILSLRVSTSVAYYAMSYFYNGMPWWAALYTTLAERQISVYGQTFARKVWDVLWQRLWLLYDFL